MKKKRKIIILISILLFTLTVTTVMFATVLFESWVTSKGVIEADTIDKVVDINDATKDNLEIDMSEQTLTFNKAGDNKTFNIQVNNRTDAIIQYQYEFSFSGSSFTDKTESFASCILVYYNQKYINTLANLCANSNNKVEAGYIEFKGYVNKANNSTYSSVIDQITFELHSSSDKSYFDTNNSISFNLKAYAKSADFEHFMYVSNISDFNRAVDDINSGACPEDIRIVLFNNLTLTENYELIYPVNIDLNGNELVINGTLKFSQAGESYITSNRLLTISSLSSSGQIILDAEEGNLIIEDFKNNNGSNIGYLYSNITSVTNSNTDETYELLIDKAKENVRYGIKANSSINLFGALSFYNINFQVGSNLTYSSDILTAANINYSSTSDITINNVKIAVKILGNNDDVIYNSLLTNELAYLVHLSETSDTGVIVNTNAADLFLPTSIKSKNVTITWLSSDPDLMSNCGTISKDIKGDQIITLYATIKINDSVYSNTFTIRIMSQNHETIFQYFVAQLSPITIEVMYNGTNSTEAYYFLPIVDSNYDVNNNENYSGYDYRSSYTTPQNIAAGDSGYNWESFANVGFEYLRYSLISTYNFISLDQNAIDSNNKNGVAVYLDQATFQTFAQINVTSKFAGDDEVYNGTVNILIDTGYNTELNELVFTKIQGDLDSVNVLQNILDTRLENNMLNEKGDFYLTGKYQTYYITYSIPQSSIGIIDRIIGYSESNEILTEVASITNNQTFTSSQILQIDKYKICLNIEEFDYSDFDLGINTILIMPTGNTDNRASRVQYFSCPGVIKCDEYGFSNMSVFNSVKYQVWYELANSITNEVFEGDVRNGNYTLASDTESFTISNGIVTNHTGAYILRHDVSQCTKLVFSLSESNVNTDNHIVYGLSKIIDWILGNTTDTFSIHFTNNVSFDSSFISSYGSYKSNGRAYISETEETVLKAYFLTYISSDTTTFDTLWNEISYQSQDNDGTYKYVLVNSSEFMEQVSTYYSNTSTYGSNRNSAELFKFQEVLQWAHNDKDFTPESGLEAGHTPDLGVVGAGDWSNLLTSNYSSWTVSWTSSWKNSKYTASPYLEDNTEYFTAYELEVILAMLLNSKGNSSNAVNNAAKAYVQNLRDTYFTIPRYLTNDGISKLISTAYSLLNKSVSGNSQSGFSAELSSFRIAGEVFNTPHVTLMDGSTIGFDYFDSLETLYILGDKTGLLKSFHTTNQVTNFFNRVTSNNLNLKNLAAEYASDTNMDFSIQNIYYLRKLEKIDLYHNQGITNIGSLLKTNMENLAYVNVADINLKNEYSSFVLESINYKSERNPEVYYSIDGYTQATLFTNVLNSNAEGLIYLEEFYELLSENAQLTQNVYSNNTSQSIQWVIESGNGIEFVTQSSNTIETLSTVYIKYYLVLNQFIYHNYTFKANHLYCIVNDNGNLGFDEVLDSNGNDMTITVGSAPNELTDQEVNQWISDNNLTPQTETIEDEHTYSEGSFSINTISTNNNSYPSGVSSSNRHYTGSSTTTVTFYDENDNRIDQRSYYGIGIYGTNTRSVTESWNTYELTNAIYGTIIKYYASYNNSTGLYTIEQCDYAIVNADSYTYKAYSKVHNETWQGHYLCTNRSGWLINTYTFVDLFSLFPTCRRYVVNNKSYNVTRTSESVGNTTLDDSQTVSNYSNKSLNGQYTLYTALGFSSTVYDNIESVLSTRYFNVSSSGITYYDNGTPTTPNFNGVYEITLSTNGGLSYTMYNNTSTVLLAKSMNQILVEANSHKNDKYLGLYYHNYYVYTGDDITYENFSYKENGVYYLELDSNGNFYWAQDSNINSQTYTQITDLNNSGSVTYEDVVKLVSMLDSTYEGKIYYYSGTASGGYTLGTRVWFIVMHNEETGAYELRKFGTISYEYDVFGSSNGQCSKTTPSNNNTGLYMICNLMKYMDSNLFTNGQTNSTFTYGVGGTRTAVITAIITAANGTKYTRKFVINVIG